MKMGSKACGLGVGRTITLYVGINCDHITFDLF